MSPEILVSVQDQAGDDEPQCAYEGGTPKGITLN